MGYFTIPIRLKVGTSGCVISCEPDAETLNRLHMNVSRNGLRNVDIRPAAVGNYDELGTPSIAEIKIDVEGTEQDVLQGSVLLLREERPWLMLETEPFERVAACLRSLDYAPVQPGGFVVANFVVVPR
jgi:precorrin-6B methylase 2